MNGDKEASIERAKRVINDPNCHKNRKPDNKPGFKGKKGKSKPKFSGKKK